MPLAAIIKWAKVASEFTAMHEQKIRVSLDLYQLMVSEALARNPRKRSGRLMCMFVSGEDEYAARCALVPGKQR